MNALQIGNHVKWAVNKQGSVMIHNRLGSCRTVFISSAAGKEIWRQVALVDSAGNCASEEQILEKLCELFEGSASPSVLRRDMEEFLDRLSEEHIITRAAG